MDAVNYYLTSLLTSVGQLKNGAANGVGCSYLIPAAELLWTPPFSPACRWAAVAAEVAQIVQQLAATASPWLGGAADQLRTSLAACQAAISAQLKAGGDGKTASAGRCMPARPVRNGTVAASHHTEGFMTSALLQRQ